MALTPKENSSSGPVAAWPTTIEHSALFRGAASPARLERQLAGAGGQVFTFHCHIKEVASTTANHGIIGAYEDADNYVALRELHGGNGFVLRLQLKTGGTAYVCDAPGLADPTGHYALTLAVDTTRPTAEDRLRLYVNGANRPFSAYPPQNATLALGGPHRHTLGCWLEGGVMADPLDGYLSDVHFVDGQALAPGSFGGFSDLVTGLWVPGTYEGTYGANGFHLDFADAADLGADVSGNGNGWTVVGAPTQTLDTPTNNACTLNPLVGSYVPALSNGNLTASATNTTYAANMACSSMAVPATGKWYWEWNVDNASDEQWFVVGEAEPYGTAQFLVNNAAIVVKSSALYIGGIYQGAVLAALSTGSVRAFAMDMDASEVSFFTDGMLDTTVPFSPGATPFHIGLYLERDSAAAPNAATLNTGSVGFAYAPPEGFKAICAANLPGGQADILSGTYTGNGSADGPFVPSNCVLASVTIGANTYPNDGTADAVRFTSAGFKIASATANNGSGTSYAWSAVKKSTSKYSNAQEG